MPRSNIPLSLERQVSVNQFKIGAVGERFAIKVFDQDPNRSSSRDGRRECPCFFPVHRGNITNIREELAFKTLLHPAGIHTDHGTGFSRRQVTRISAPDYPLQ